MARILLLVDEYIRSLSYIVFNPGKIKGMDHRKIIMYSMITLASIAISKEAVIVGSVFYKVIKWTITWFPSYSFIYAYADYVSFWIILIAFMVEVGICYAYAFILHYTVRLLGGNAALPLSLGVTAYSWVADIVIIATGLLTINLDIASTVVVLLSSIVVALVLKIMLIARLIAVIHNIKLSTSVVAVILVTIMFGIIGLTIIVV